MVYLEVFWWCRWVGGHGIGCFGGIIGRVGLNRSNVGVSNKLI